MAKPKNPTKRNQIDPEKLKKILQLRPTVRDVAGIFEVSYRLIQKYIEDEYSMTFLEYRDHCMASVKLNLIKIAIQKAQKGDNDMIKYCLNNLAGWASNPVQRSEEEEIESMEF